MLPPAYAPLVSSFAPSSAHVHQPSASTSPSTLIEALQALSIASAIAALAMLAFIVVVAVWRAHRRSPPRQRPTPATPTIDRERRLVVKYGTAGLLSAGFGGIGILQSGSSGSSGGFDIGQLSDNVGPCFNNSPLARRFAQPLFIPPAIPPTRVVGTDDIYDIWESRGETVIVPGFKTPIWGYSLAGQPATFPGPTILARKGRRVIVNFENRLPPNEDPSGIILEQEIDPRKHPFHDSSTSVHLHGINADHFSDGYPDDADGHRHRKGPGESFQHVYPNNGYQRPATLWYHDHSVHVTSVHIFRGLAALYLLSDEIEDSLRLPGSPLADPGRGYGFFDVPLVIKDVMITGQERDDRPPGTLVYNNCSHMGAFGDVMTVNGRQQPRLDVANRKYRFRVLDAGDARQFWLALRLSTRVEDGPDEPMTLIGTDQGLLPAAMPVTDFHIAPAERCEIVIDFSRYPIGTRLVLVNKLEDPDEPRLFQIMAFDVTRPEPDTSEVRPVLRGAEHPADTAPPARQRLFLFDRQGGYWSINGKQWDANRVDARPVIDTNEDWILEVDSAGWGHPVHLHLGRFRILEVEGRPPRPGELEGFKDTVWVGPNQKITLRHQFWNFNGRYVFHCHNGSHEDHDMMSQWEVQPPLPAADAQA
jgi:spore coat protein A, manganese oxidase